jgi:hypothetical protein
MEIWEIKPPATLWATPGLLRDSFNLQDLREKKDFVNNLKVLPILVFFRVFILFAETL